jgi:hypothetical protein
MKATKSACLILVSLAALAGCETSISEPLTGPIVTGGPTLTFQGTVRSARDGSPVSGAKIRLYAPGEPFDFPFTVAATETTPGGSYILRLPAEFNQLGNCEVWHLSARAYGFDAEGDVAGILCTAETQQFDFTLVPVPSN